MMLRLALLAWLLVTVVTARQGQLVEQVESSADWDDLEEGMEGSGEEELVLHPDKDEEDDIYFSSDKHEKTATKEESFEYYNEQYDEYNYEDEYEAEDDDEYEYIDKESVLIIDQTPATTHKDTKHTINHIPGDEKPQIYQTNHPPDIEIRQTKPPVEQTTSYFETSHILIMAGSALVSFGVVMLAFFMCRRTLDDKARKTTVSYVLPPPRGTREASPIVKNYQRVPTTTKEFLQSQSHIDMYRGDGAQPAADPLLQYSVVN